MTVSLLLTEKEKEGTSVVANPLRKTCYFTFFVFFHLAIASDLNMFLKKCVPRFDQCKLIRQCNLKDLTLSFRNVARIDTSFYCC